MKNFLSLILLVGVALYFSACSCKRSEDPAPAQQTTARIFASSEDYMYKGFTVNTMHNPRGIAKDGSGNFYISNVTMGIGHIYKITPDTVISEVGFVADPQAIAVDAGGNVYTVSPGENIIYKMTADGTVNVLAGSRTAGFTNGNGTDASFDNPSGIAVDTDGNIFVTDFNNSAIRKITTDGTVSTFLSAADQATSEEKLVVPYGITIDSTTGVFYVTDGVRVLKITADGNVSKAYKEKQSGVSPFVAPVAVASDATGNLYVSDIYDLVVYKINPHGNVSLYYGVKVGHDPHVIIFGPSYGILTFGKYVFATVDYGLVYRFKP